MKFFFYYYYEVLACETERSELRGKCNQNNYNLLLPRLLRFLCLKLLSSRGMMGDFLNGNLIAKTLVPFLSVVFRASWLRRATAA